MKNTPQLIFSERFSLDTPAPAIILIENDEVTLELYQRELCKSFTVFAFTELNRVLEVMEKQDIRAVVIEPEIDSGKGWGLIHSIFESYPDRSIPVIVCSTRDSSNTGSALEVEKYLTKPVLPKTLREKTLEIVREMDKLKRSL
jgi:DNA-binding response OmpR family regulator